MVQAYRHPSLLLILAILSSLLAGRLLASEDVPSQTLQTEHYDLRVETLDADEVGRLLEALHRHLAAFFGRAPQEKLRVEIYASRQRFQAALQADRQRPVEAGGYYAPGTKKAYLWVQPSDYYTRQLLLHECTHQFHFLVAAANRSPKLDLYTEGLAEYFGMHNWDGQELKVGAVPTLSLEDYPRKALDHFQNTHQRDLQGMLTGQRASARPEAWGLVHFLINVHPAAFRAWAARLDQQTPPADAWPQALAPSFSSLAQDYERWLQTHQQPWQIHFVAWQQWGGAIEGKTRNQAVGITLLKSTPRTLSVQLEPAEKSMRAGLVFGYQSPQDYCLFQLTSARKLMVIRRHEGQWHVDETWDAPPALGGDVLSLNIAESAVVLRANGRTLGTLPATGQVGLHIQEGRVRFRVK